MATLNSALKLIFPGCVSEATAATELKDTILSEFTVAGLVLDCIDLVRATPLTVSATKT